MISVITGDIINSRKLAPAKWLSRLKQELKSFGATPKYWEVYSGDSFQLRVNEPENALAAVLTIKAAIMSLPKADVRMAIGIGNVSHEAKKITECNGEAFIHSGELFEQLPRLKQDVAIKTPWADFNEEFNLYLKFLKVAMRSWTEGNANVAWHALINPDKSQEALGKLLGMKQNAVSNHLKRAAYDVVTDLNARYMNSIKQRL